jgi:dihydropteroate synthase/2-amino-4-hydroxy-6-hydroxymethyldihydropteridine diphosphokinase
LSKSSQIFLSIGTNLGERQENLQRAIDALGEVMAVESISPIYETAPWGKTDQPDFLNACLSGQTDLKPRELLDSCKEIERRLGRQPGSHWGPRLIDIDIVIYGDQIVDEEKLQLPHPQLGQRAFVLAPLADIAPDLVHPQNSQTITDMLQSVDHDTVERLPMTEAMLRRPVLFNWGIKTYVMGILNVTPDSFSGDGLLMGRDWIEATVEKAKEFVAQGVDIIDIGGESTRPGSTPISAEEEKARVLPVIEAIRPYVDVPLSIDTYRASIAQAALDAGVDWINDVWGLRMDPGMAGVVAERGCPVVIMHNRSQPKNADQQARLGGRYIGIHYENLFQDISRELQESIEIATSHHVRAQQIIVDPGIGFGKTIEQNLALLNRLDTFKELGYPILVGPSRKSFIGYTLDLPPEERLEGTAAAVTIAIDRGADIVRVHDVKEMVRIARMADAILG